MRRASSVLAVLLAPLAAASAATAPDVGTSVVVVRPTRLETPRGKATELTPGTSLVVQDVEGDSLTVAAGKVGRIERSSVIPLAEAVAHFSATIAKAPRDATAYLARGKVWFQQGELDKAIDDLDECLRLEPRTVEAHTIRGWAWKRKGDKDRAMADFDRAIALDPDDALAWRVRGATWASRKEYARARSDYSESIRIDPENPDSLNHRALLLSACNDASFRDGKQAVADATRACEITGWKHPLYLSNLAVAYAETGDFAAAIAWHKKAMDRSPQGQVKSMQARLEQYQQHQPFRMTWR
jgi:tetratricopeptide (TPR) repeat protein